jgi:4-hydroxysphinganine ceramide fatty acyl 2-hydroxylase
LLNAAMRHERIDQVKLFRNPWLERLTVVSLRGFVIFWAIGLPVIFWAAQGSAGGLQAMGLFAAGLLVWSLTEYALHRHLFHWQPRGAVFKRLMFMIHGNHHLAPSDPLRNLMPPVVSVPVGLLVWAICLATIGPAGTWLLAGFMSGYVAYDLIHYGCHQWSVASRFSGAFKSNHMRHHYARENGNYAITGMFWDRFFGTRITPQKL